MWTGGGGSSSSGGSGGGRQRQYASADGMALLKACAAGPCDGGGDWRADARPAWGSVDANAVCGWDWLQFEEGVGSGAGTRVQVSNGGKIHYIFLPLPS